MKIDKVKLSLSALVMASLFTGCGGGSGTVNTDTTTSGTAVDGYLSNATVQLVVKQLKLMQMVNGVLQMLQEVLLQLVVVQISLLVKLLKVF